MPEAAAEHPTRDAEAPMAGASARQALAEDLIDAALGAWREGSFAPLVQRRPLAARWMMRRLRRVLRGTVGDVLGPEGDLATEAQWMLRWAVTQLRPDREPHFDAIGIDEWLRRPAWRSMLAVMCHSRMATAPDFPQQYRRKPGESAADNLCGLWDVDPSTFYRYIERGQRALAALVSERPSVPQRLSLRRYLAAEISARRRWKDDRERVGWHRRQADAASAGDDAASALWHALQAADGAAATRIVVQHAAALAGEPETDALVDRVAALMLNPRQRLDLWLARATLARTRQAPEREEQACRQALALAEVENHPLWRGLAQSALGRFYEARDAERAFTYYQESLGALRQADPDHEQADARQAFLGTLARLAFMHVRRNQPGVRAMLDEAVALVSRHGAPPDVEGLLEQVWAEYWRIAGDPERALRCRLRALTIFERVGDRRSVLATHRNLMQMYADAGDLDRVEQSARVIFTEAARTTVEPAILIGAEGNLGYAYGAVGQYERAIQHYRRALEHAIQARHEQFANLTRHNLANAYYRRFLETGDAEFERLGDEEAHRVLLAPRSAVTPALVEEVRGLKASVLGREPERSIDQLHDEETAAHLSEMAEIKRQRQVLARAPEAAGRAEAHLAIARAYAAIAAREREAARELVERDGLADRFRGEFADLHQTFERELTREARVGEAWRRAAGDLLDDARRAALISRLLRDGSINKSGYGEMCAVSPATASKHLVTLAERGLLVQRGKGPSTRYELPA
jgi:tetratricopeptide (TPR) repeat protein